jgi:hypothetical protein
LPVFCWKYLIQPVNRVEMSGHTYSEESKMASLEPFTHTLVQPTYTYNYLSTYKDCRKHLHKRFLHALSHICKTSKVHHHIKCVLGKHRVQLRVPVREATYCLHLPRSWLLRPIYKQQLKGNLKLSLAMPSTEKGNLMQHLLIYCLSHWAVPSQQTIDQGTEHNHCSQMKHKKTLRIDHREPCYTTSQTLDMNTHSQSTRIQNT